MNLRRIRMNRRMDDPNIDWGKLGFSYLQTDCSYVSYYRDGKWDDGELVEENTITISMGSPALHYGQQCFEGLKAYRNKEGKVQMFRIDENAKRLNRACDKLVMPHVPVEKFIDACYRIVYANERFVPPYGSGANLYVRPYLIGIGDNIGVKPASTYLFGVFCMPVGPYFKNGMAPSHFGTTTYDRAAPMGTGNIKAGGNYAGSLKPHMDGVESGFADVIYLDPATHTKIEEVGSANFFGITKDNVFVTPKSTSILPGITLMSLKGIARDVLGMKVEERECHIDKIDEFVEAGACGTAAVITPIGSITHQDHKHVFFSETEVGPVTKKLYDTLHDMQIGDMEAPEGWVFNVEANYKG